MMENSYALDMMLQFVEKHTNLYLYGAGEYGVMLLSLIQKKGLKVSGFIVSDKSRESVWEVPIYEYNEISLHMTKNDGVIVSMHKRYHTEIKFLLEKCTADVMFVDEELLDFYIKKQFYKDMKSLAIKFPPLPYCNSHDWKRILLIRIDRIGDLIWCSAFFRELRRNFPLAKITAIVEKKNRMIVETCPYLDSVFYYDNSQNSNKWYKRAEMFKRAGDFIKQNMYGEEFDAVFMLRSILWSDELMINVFLAIQSSARVRIAKWFFCGEKVDKTLRTLMAPFFSLVVDHAKPKHEVAKTLDMLRAIGCKIKNERMEFFLSCRSSKDIPFYSELADLKSKGKRLIAVGLVASDASRSWRPKNYRRLFECMQGRDVVFVLIGGNEARDVARKVYLEECTLNLVGKTDLQQVAHLISICDIYLGSDTGILHIAACFGKSSVVISSFFPWGDKDGILSPIRVGPWNVNGVVLQPPKALDGRCRANDCCISTTSHCINTITVQSVQKALYKVMGHLE